MQRKRILKIVNPILFLLVVNQLATGIWPGLYGAGTFRIVHKQMALILSIGLLSHLILNLPWIKNAYLKQKPKIS